MRSAADSVEDSLRLVRDTFDAWLRQDLERMAAGLADDFVQWHSHIGREFSKQEHQALLRKVLGSVTFHYHHVTYLPLDGGVLVRCLCDVRASNGASADDIPFALVYRVRGGKIVRCDEYMDGLSIPQMPFLP